MFYTAAKALAEQVLVQPVLCGFFRRGKAACSPPPFGLLEQQKASLRVRALAPHLRALALAFRCKMSLLASVIDRVPVAPIPYSLVPNLAIKFAPPLLAQVQLVLIDTFPPRGILLFTTF